MNKKILLSKLVAIESIYPNEKRIGEFLYKYLLDIGFVVEKQSVSENRFNLLAEKGNGKKSLLFYAHMDTVPVVNRENWKTNPFKVSEKNGKYFSLGAYDMKAGITAILNAVQRSKEYVKVFFAVDEENISLGAWQAVKKRKDFFKNVELIISAEPNMGLGLNSITTERTGRYIFQIDFKGKPEHIINYKKAIDAIELLGEFIENLYSQRNRLFNDKQTVVQVRKVEGESVGMSVCGQATIEVEVLAGSKDSLQSVKHNLQGLTEARVFLRPRKTPYLQGYSFRSFSYRREIAEIIKRYTGKNMKLHSRKSVADDNVLATLGIPVITWGPSGGNAHSANEWVNAGSLNKLTDMFTVLLNTRRE